MFVKKDGKVLWFADSKAEKNYKLGRKPRNVSWTDEGRAAKQARMAAAEHAEKPAKRGKAASSAPKPASTGKPAAAKSPAKGAAKPASKQR